jgi:hypothetical protein
VFAPPEMQDISFLLSFESLIFFIGLVFNYLHGGSEGLLPLYVLQ